MAHGGKRKGAGRPRRADLRVLVNFTLSRKTVDLLRMLVSAGDRSIFVEAAIMAALNAL
jgi:hypothetical protein